MKLSQHNAYYVALGSSFAAGLGLGPRAPGSPIVSQRSQNGYPQQLARLLDVSSFVDMTSSGSTVHQVLNGGQWYLGPQVDALGPDTRLVTLTAGGNDVGYIGDLMFSAYRNRRGVLGFLFRLLWKGPKSFDERDFDSLDTNMRATLAEIRRRSPNALIIVATYPTLLSTNARCQELGLTDDQIKLMLPVGEKLAEITRVAAVDAGATIVDMAALSADHDVCGNEPWVNGAFPKIGTAFHPTFAGAQATAQAIFSRIREVSGALVS